MPWDLNGLNGKLHGHGVFGLLRSSQSNPFVSMSKISDIDHQLRNEWVEVRVVLDALRITRMSSRLEL